MNFKKIWKMMSVLHIVIFALSICGFLYFAILKDAIGCGISGLAMGYTYSVLFGKIWRESWESSGKQ
jgi:hypothetical protein